MPTKGVLLMRAGVASQAAAPQAQGAVPFHAAWWCRGSHAQTVWAGVLRHPPQVRVTRVRWELPDGDFLDVDELAHLKEPNHSPRFWSLVAGQCPTHHAARTWLRTFGPGLSV